jgi:hypothetical protein
MVSSYNFMQVKVFRGQREEIGGEFTSRWPEADDCGTRSLRDLLATCTRDPGRALTGNGGHSVPRPIAGLAKDPVALS